jgi:hypothetical protein
MQDVLSWLSLIVGIGSIAISVFAIWYARTTEQESRGQFNKTKDLLSEIDKRSALIERTVSDSQKDMMATITRIIDATVIPQKQNMGELFAAEMMQSLMQDPAKGAKTLKALQPFIDLAQQSKNSSE